MFGFSTQKIVLFASLLVGSMVLTTGVVLLMIVRISDDYFVSKARDDFENVRSPALRILLLIGKNLLGAVLVFVGILLALPGVPGQGVLTILVGLLFLDIPGKRKLLLRIVRQPKVLKAMNGLRARYGKEPFIVHRDVVEP